MKASYPNLKTTKITLFRVREKIFEKPVTENTCVTHESLKRIIFELQFLKKTEPARPEVKSRLLVLAR